MHYMKNKSIMIFVFMFSSYTAVIAGNKAELNINGNVDVPVARQYRHEIGVHFGYASNVGENRMSKIGDYLVEQLDYWDFPDGNIVYPFSWGIHYYYHIDKFWALGVDYAYAFGNNSIHYSYWNNDVVIAGCDVLVRSHLMMAVTKRQWADIAPMYIYSKLAIGLQHRHVYCSYNYGAAPTNVPKDRRWAFAYQISPLCIEMGGKRVRFFAELGYGNEGVASIGISTRL